MTLALLEDSGLYRANYSMAEQLDWGHNQGKKFLTLPCPTAIRHIQLGVHIIRKLKVFVPLSDIPGIYQFGNATFRSKTRVATLPWQIIVLVLWLTLMSHAQT